MLQELGGGWAATGRDNLSVYRTNVLQQTGLTQVSLALLESAGG